MIEFVREKAMSPTVPRQKINLAAVQFPSDQHIGGRSKGCIYRVFGRVAQLLYLI